MTWNPYVAAFVVSLLTISASAQPKPKADAFGLFDQKKYEQAFKAVTKEFREKMSENDSECWNKRCRQLIELEFKILLVYAAPEAIKAAEEDLYNFIKLIPDPTKKLTLL